VADREAEFRTSRLALGMDTESKGAFATLSNQGLVAASVIMTAKMRATFLLLDAQQDKVKIELRRRVAEEAFAIEPNILLQIRSAATASQVNTAGFVSVGSKM
jgi:hypothetical protein